MERRPDWRPPHKMLVGTHHKTGTVWWRLVMAALCRRAGLVFAEVSEDHDWSTCPGDVLFQDHSRFPLASLPQAWRGVHVIRDPRDVIISGCFYHAEADEPWLMQPPPISVENSTRSYQQCLGSLTTIEERLVFELEQAGTLTIQEMLDWDYSDSRFMNVKYEMLVDDVELRWFRDIFAHLGVPESMMQVALQSAWDYSLASGKVPRGPTIHVRDGRPAQWKRHFTRNTGRRFLELFPDALQVLGYEQDASWLELLRC